MNTIPLPLPKGMEKSPWDVSTFEEFLYYCCPECDTKDKDFNAFIQHALDFHPGSEKYLKNEAPDAYDGPNSFDIKEDSDMYGSADVKIKQEPSDMLEVEFEEANEYDLSNDYFGDESFDDGYNYPPDTKKGIKLKLKSENMQEKVSLNLVCSACEETYHTKYKFKKHFTVNTKCEHCSMDLNCAGLLRRHVSEMHADLVQTSFKCEDCGKLYDSKKKWKTHVRIMHRNVEPCGVCGKEFPQQHLKYHIMQVHEKQRNFECGQCGKFYALKKQYLQHIKHVHEKEKYHHHVCETCGKAFVNNTQLENHMLTHTGERNHHCDKCPKRFYTQQHLINHIKNIHDDSKESTTCDLCDAQFENRQKLNYHKTFMHSDKSEKFLCNYCPEVFGRKQHCNRHMEDVHEEYRKCGYCQRVFTRRLTMIRHVETVHEKTQSFQCHLCEKTFVSHDYLKAHIKTHQGYKPFKCELCNREFTQRIQYNKHLESHEHKSKAPLPLPPGLHHLDQQSQEAHKPPKAPQVPLPLPPGLQHLDPHNQEQHKPKIPQVPLPLPHGLQVPKSSPQHLNPNY